MEAHCYCYKKIDKKTGEVVYISFDLMSDKTPKEFEKHNSSAGLKCVLITREEFATLRAQGILIL